MKPRIDRRIFVVGVPRSGTTLVQSLLAAHSGVTSFTESHFFSRYFRALPRLSSAILTRDPSPRVRDFLLENEAESSFVAASMGAVRTLVPAEFLLPLKTHTVARQLLGVFDRLAQKRGFSTWIEKTPRHLRFVPFLQRLTSDVHVVHVIRNGLETVASLHKASKNWEQAYDLDTCVARWNADVAFSLSRCRKRSSADHFVSYEQLTTDPAATLERLLADLGLDWEPEILETYDSSRLVTSEESWKTDVDRGIRPSATSQRVLSTEQCDRVRAMLDNDLYSRLLEATAP